MHTINNNFIKICKEHPDVSSTKIFEIYGDTKITVTPLGYSMSDNIDFKDIPIDLIIELQKVLKDIKESQRSLAGKTLDFTMPPLPKPCKDENKHRYSRRKN